MRTLFVITLLVMLITGCAESPQSGSPQIPEVPMETPLAVEDNPGEPVTLPDDNGGKASTDALLAFVAEDGNLAIYNLSTGEIIKLTNDASPDGYSTGTDVVNYHQPKWSSDGTLLAFERQHGRKISEGYEFRNSLMVYDTGSESTRTVLENVMLAGYDWQPGKNALAFALAVEPAYFQSRQGVNSSAAGGIWLADLESGSSTALGEPERGFALVNPRWSPDGRFIGFEELLYMEGRGNFAYYELASRSYIGREKAIGNYAWSPDGEWLVYDNLAYLPTGEERITTSLRDGTQETQFSPDYAKSYAYLPVISADGTKVAYLVENMDEETATQRILVQSSQGGDVTDLGIVEQPGSLQWSPDGTRLYLASGYYPASSTIISIDLADGSTATLINGSQPAIQPGMRK